MTDLHVETHIKMVKETLCVAQVAVARMQHLDNSWTYHVDVLQKLINECDRQRPVGSNGKHGNLHTETCGCDD